MALRRWNPWDEMQRLREEMSQLIESLSPTWLRGEGAWQPTVDIFEAGKDVVLKADLPGVDPKDLEVRVFSDSVTIKAHVEREEEVERPGYYQRERRYGSLFRQVKLPAQVIPEDARATYKNGVLELRMPKAEDKSAQGFKVDVQAQD